MFKLNMITKFCCQVNIQDQLFLVHDENKMANLFFISYGYVKLQTCFIAVLILVALASAYPKMLKDKISENVFAS